MFKKDEERPLKLMPKLTREHLYLTPHSKMRVNLAAQVMSSSVANVMTTYGLPEFSETAHFISLVDRFFDCLNTRSLTEADRRRKPDLKPYTSDNDTRFTFLLEEFLPYFHKWHSALKDLNISKTEFEKKCISVQTYEGLMITCQSAVEVSRILLADVKMPYILTTKFSQDPIEQHFGRHRTVGRRSDNPSLLQYMHQDNNFRVLRNAQYSLTPHGNITHNDCSTSKTKTCIRIHPFQKNKN